MTHSTLHLMTAGCFIVIFFVANLIKNAQYNYVVCSEYHKLNLKKINLNNKSAVFYE